MTSNVGATILKNQATLGFQSASADSSYEHMKDLLTKEVEHQFRPEFLNRVDDIIVFKQLNRDDLKLVIEIELKGVNNRLKDRGVNMEVSEEAKEYLIERGFNPEFGARPLRRIIERMIEDPLSEEILKGSFKEEKLLKVEIRDGHLYFNTTAGKDKEEPKPEEAVSSQENP